MLVFHSLYTVDEKLGTNFVNNNEGAAEEKTTEEAKCEKKTLLQSIVTSISFMCHNYNRVCVRETVSV